MWSAVQVAEESQAKMVHQMMVQQQAGHPMLSWVYLPSAPTGVKHYQTSMKNIDSLSQEWDHLGREARAAQVLYTTTGMHGQETSFLMQPAHASGITAPVVPWIQLQELCLKNAGTTLMDQALAQNLIFFRERERGRKQRGQSRSTEVATLADMIGGTAPTPAPPAEQQQTEANMEVMEQSDNKAMEETEA